MALSARSPWSPHHRVAQSDIYTTCCRKEIAGLAQPLGPTWLPDAGTGVLPGMSTWKRSPIVAMPMAGRRGATACPRYTSCVVEDPAGTPVCFAGNIAGIKEAALAPGRAERSAADQEAVLCDYGIQGPISEGHQLALEGHVLPGGRRRGRKRRLHPVRNVVGVGSAAALEGDR